MRDECRHERAFNIAAEEIKIPAGKTPIQNTVILLRSVAHRTMCSTERRTVDMSQTTEASKRRRRRKAIPVLGAAGALSLAGGAAYAATAPSADVSTTKTTTTPPQMVLGEEEIADVTLSKFYVFDKENATKSDVQVAWGHGCGGCRGCGRGCGCRCGFRGCGGCGWGWGCCASWGRCRWC
jgi:hypothetical protein